MTYTMMTPCAECPFLAKFANGGCGYSVRQLEGYASGEFPCHKSAELVEDDEAGSCYRAVEKSVHCAGALIYLEKRDRPHQMMRICERLGMYDRTKLDMEAPVR